MVSCLWKLYHYAVLCPSFSPTAFFCLHNHSCLDASSPVSSLIKASAKTLFGLSSLISQEHYPCCVRNWSPVVLIMVALLEIVSFLYTVSCFQTKLSARNFTKCPLPSNKIFSQSKDSCIISHIRFH